MSGEKIEVENINTPGRITRVNRAKYEATRTALIQTLPATAPGLSQPTPKRPPSRFCPKTCSPAVPLRAGGSNAVSSSRSQRRDRPRAHKAPQMVPLLTTRRISRSVRF